MILDELFRFVNTDFCCYEWPGNSFGIKIVGGKIISDKSNEVGAFVTAIQRGGIADQLHGEVQEGSLIFSIPSLI